MRATPLGHVFRFAASTETLDFASISRTRRSKVAADVAPRLGAKAARKSSTAVRVRSSKATAVPSPMWNLSRPLSAVRGVQSK